MARPRLLLGLLAPVSLLILVAALGALQYRWVGQVSQAEREQLKESLDRRAREFADEFDREIGRAYQTFQPAAGLLTPEAPGRLPQQYEEWRSVARFPDMLKAAYLATLTDGNAALHRYSHESQSFEAIAWPDSLESARNRIAQGRTRAISPQVATGAGPTMVIGTMPVLPDVPALVIAGTLPAPAGKTPDVLHVPGVTAEFTLQVRPPTRFLILELNREFIASTILPALAERHFPSGDADRFRISVVDGTGRTVLSRGLTAGQSLDPVNADAATGFFGIRIELVRGMMAQVTGKPSGPATVMWSTRTQETATTVQTRDRLSMVFQEHAGVAGAVSRAAAPPGWTLLLQHSAGSLDAAVDRVRRRNLWLSFGILSVLLVSTGLVLVNARRSERLAAQQLDFVATVSHELRTPVAVIRSAAQNLAAGVVHEPEQARRYGALIETEGRRLTDMVEQVLEYAGLSDARRAPPTRPVDAGGLVREVVAASESLPEAARVVFEVRIDPRAPVVMADEDALRRALLNLIGNALKYGADGGWIGVTVAPGAGRDADYVLVAVADRGRGIPGEDLAHIFEPFYRGAYARDRQIHGNGLGLSLVKRIVETHGGRVTVKSAPGQGSTFTLYWPVARDVAVGTPASAADAVLRDAAGSSGGRSV